jgi:hypothetical protein
MLLIVPIYSTLLTNLKKKRQHQHTDHTITHHNMNQQYNVIEENSAIQHNSGKASSRAASISFNSSRSIVSSMADTQ